MDCHLAEREAAGRRRKEGLSFPGSFFSRIKSKFIVLIIGRDYLNDLRVYMVVVVSLNSDWEIYGFQH